MSRMIDDMLFLAKADNGLIIPQQTHELTVVIAKLFEYYQLLADERGITLSVCGAGEVLGDPLMLERVIANLLANALRYTPAGATIHLRLQQSECLTRLSIETPATPSRPNT